MSSPAVGDSCFTVTILMDQSIRCDGNVSKSGCWPLMTDGNVINCHDYLKSGLMSGGREDTRKIIAGSDISRYFLVVHVHDYSKLIVMQNH